MTRFHLSLLVLALAVVLAAFAGQILWGDAIMWGTLGNTGDAIVWGT